MADSENESNTVVADDTIGTSLCISCQRLDLSVHRFIISRLDPKRANKGAGPATAVGSNVQLRSGETKKEFAQLGQLKARRANCPFCNLVCRAVKRYSSIRVGTETALFLTWEVDGRQIGKGARTVNRTRRIRLSWRETSGKEESVYLVLVAPQGARGTNSDAYAAHAKESHFLGRSVIENKEKQALMKSWIDLCVDKHGTRCENIHSTTQDFMRLAKSTYFGVVDVIDMQLKALPIINGKPARYVALSYVWGRNPLNDKPYTTTRANIMVRIQHGGLENEWQRLPRTIQEAILLVARLGERYLWIDALCIVQDSTTSWELNAKAMHLVYGNAHFTICAADGDVDAGLRAASPILRIISTETHRKRASAIVSPPLVTVSQAMPSRQRPASLAPDSTRSAFPYTHGMTTEEVRSALRAADAAEHPPLTAKCLPNVRLLVSRPPEVVIEDSMWNKRGWTFQERLLSRRCLIFAEGQVYFQCRSTVISQHIFTDGGINGWSLDWTNSPLRTLGELQRRAFWFYMKCVPLYTSRNLTETRDILTAFQGTSWLLQQRLGAPLLYGLPTSHFDLALLWMPSRQLDRRIQGRLGTRDETGSNGHNNEGFPSWSWSGWIGGNADYPLSMVEGCVANVQEWLKYHTWIRWYIRDYEGNLRPLWDRNVLVEDKSIESRWRGYAGTQSSDTERPDAPVTIRFRPQPRHHSDSKYGRERHTEKDRDYYKHAPATSLEDRVRQRIRNTGQYHGSQRLGSGRDGRWFRQPNTAYLSNLPPGYYDGYDNGDNPDGELQDGSSLPVDSARQTGTHRYTRASTVRAQSDDPDVYPYVSPGTGSSIEPGQRSGAATVSLEGNTLYENRKPDDDGEGIEESEEEYDEEEPYHGSELRASETSSDDDDTSAYHSTSTSNAEKVEDNFGRPIRTSVRDLNAIDFMSIIPDNPFSIIRGPFSTTKKDHQIKSMPILQFWTWRTELLIASRPVPPRPDSSRQSPAPGVSDALSKLSRHDIVDKAGDWCGSIMLPARHSNAQNNGAGNLTDDSASHGSRRRDFERAIFIALSDARSLTTEECPVWNYYIAKERDESEWDLFYVMMLSRNHERALWERIAVGKVFQAAFRDADWDEIKLG